MRGKLEREESSCCVWPCSFSPSSRSARRPHSAEDGSDLWLRYERVDDHQRLEQYRRAVPPSSWRTSHANKVHRQTADLRMEPGSTEKLVESRWRRRATSWSAA